MECKDGKWNIFSYIEIEYENGFIIGMESYVNVGMMIFDDGKVMLIEMEGSEFYFIIGMYFNMFDEIRMNFDGELFILKVLSSDKKYMELEGEEIYMLGGSFYCDVYYYFI